MQFQLNIFNLFLIYYLAPSTPPVNVMAILVNSSGFTLVWDAPPAVDHNGVIRYYVIHITEINTGLQHTLNSTLTLTAVYFLLFVYLHAGWN